MSELAARFMRVFEGYMLAHGTYDTEMKSALKKKVEIKGSAVTKREPITEELWEQHLSGERSLGVIPIRSDSTCIWGCIDVDKYDNTDLPGLVQRIAKASLPLVVCRSKSGGAHVFLFVKEAISAADMRHKLEEIAAVLGYGGCEIFPKQTQIAYDRGDLGNWLNMPYFGGARTTRYGLLPNGEAASMELFLDLVERTYIGDIAKVKATSIKPGDSEFKDGPPCLELLTADGFPEGTRNNGLFALGVFIKKKYGESALQDKLHEFNFKYLQPPLPASEVDQVYKSLAKGNKTYNYKCTEHPCLSYCNRGACITRQFGVGSSSDSPLRYGSLTILTTEHPAYFLDVIMEDGETKRADFRSCAEMTQQRTFLDRVTEVCHRRPPRMSNQGFDQFIDALLKEATQIQPPEEFTEFGQFRELLEEYCMSRSKANFREDVQRGKVWTEEGYHWFQMKGLNDFLQKRQYKDDKKFILDKLKKLGGVKTSLRGKESILTVWRIPEFVREATIYEFPNVTDGAI